MIESPDPVAAASRLALLTGLPNAWPYAETADYDSIGINFGTVNVEFIRFRVRFGRPASHGAGLSGIAFELPSGAAATWAHDSLEHRIGEVAPAHTTITLAESTVDPTIFLVEYRFDTSGWRARLSREHDACRGGRFGISGIQQIAIPGLPASLSELCAGLVCTSSRVPALRIAARERPDAATRDALRTLLGGVDIEFA